MIRAPHIYSEWARVFDTLEKGTDDAGYLQAIELGTIEWTSGVAERFFKRAMKALNTRYNQAQDRFMKNQERAWSEGELIQNLLFLRREFQFLKDAANIPAIPDKYRDALVQNVVDLANQTQKSLEDSSGSLGGLGHGRLDSVIRNHKVNQLR